MVYILKFDFNKMLIMIYFLKFSIIFVWNLIVYVIKIIIVNDVDVYILCFLFYIFDGFDF